ncbi:hypothetical protein KIN20_004277 [Parelaphostrongylus tenuis]|uniref:Uncharacterized protein n=1 Tax=Parelaphostrongylus tenuis TaxID=148309 RepID=A0AAD5MH17_PARTN|nr:hypothetical protein KIN20_004277 [Parelaphostrongylus tenuis]
MSENVLLRPCRRDFFETIIIGDEFRVIHKRCSLRQPAASAQGSARKHLRREMKIVEDGGCSFV